MGNTLKMQWNQLEISALVKEYSNNEHLRILQLRWLTA